MAWRIGGCRTKYGPGQMVLELGLVLACRIPVMVLIFSHGCDATKMVVTVELRVVHKNTKAIS